MPGAMNDDLLSDLHDTGVFAIAQELGILSPTGADTGSIEDAEFERRERGGYAHKPERNDSTPTAVPASTKQTSQTLRKRAYPQTSDAEGKEGSQSPPSSKKKQPPRSASRQTGEKGGKGLRHFSMKVCEKVESKGRTTYNEVADELVAELQNPENQTPGDTEKFDEKNIRRRVYDALNVLMAMNIIAKEKKDITWKGLPTRSQMNVESLNAEKLRCATRIEKKRELLEDLSEEYNGLLQLYRRNNAQPLPEGPDRVPIHLPFLMVHTKLAATVDVEVAEDQQLVMLDFNSSQFEIRDEKFVMQQMGLSHARQTNGGV